MRLEEALKIAKKRNPRGFEHYIEYEKSYLFTNPSMDGRGGESTPVVVMKNGDFIHYVYWRRHLYEDCVISEGDL